MIVDGSFFFFKQSINQSMILFVNVGHRPIIQNYIHDQYKTKELQLHYDIYSVERRPHASAKMEYIKPLRNIPTKQ